MSTSDETYIGDGVYVCPAYDGIKLRTRRREGDHWIFLGPNEWSHLVEYVMELEKQAFKPPEES